MRVALMTVAAAMCLTLLPVEAQAGWKENQLKQASTIERDRQNRRRINQNALKRETNPAIKTYIQRKLDVLDRTTEVLAIYRAAINANDKIKAARAREAIHLLRLELESMNTQIELNISKALYSVFGGAVKGEIIGHLDQLLAKSDAHTASFDPVIDALVAGAR